MNVPHWYVLHRFDHSCWFSQLISVVSRGQTGARDCLAQVVSLCLRCLLSISSYPWYLSPGEYGAGAVSFRVKCFLVPRLAVESHLHANQWKVLIMFNFSNYLFGVWSDGMIDQSLTRELSGIWQGEVCKLLIGAVCLGCRLLGYMMMSEFLFGEVNVPSLRTHTHNKTLEADQAPSRSRSSKE